MALTRGAAAVTPAPELFAAAERSAALLVSASEELHPALHTVRHLATLYAALLEQGIVPAGAAEEALEVHIHPQISSDGRTEAELEELTRAAILSKLPKVNHPLEA